MGRYRRLVNVKASIYLEPSFYYCPLNCFERNTLWRHISGGPVILNVTSSWTLFTVALSSPPKPSIGFTEESTGDTEHILYTKLNEFDNSKK